MIDYCEDCGSVESFRFVQIPNPLDTKLMEVVEVIECKACGAGDEMRRCFAEEQSPEDTEQD